MGVENEVSPIISNCLYISNKIKVSISMLTEKVYRNSRFWKSTNCKAVKS